MLLKAHTALIGSTGSNDKHTGSVKRNTYTGNGNKTRVENINERFRKNKFRSTRGPLRRAL